MVVAIMSCTSQKQLDFESEDITRIDVYQRNPGTTIRMKYDFEVDLIKDLIESKYIGPTKYAKTHKIIIYDKNGQIDTIWSNGTVHCYKECYRSDENLIDKYNVD